MKKLRAVFKREYIQAVRKKSFLIMTILMPFLMAALMVVPQLLMMKSIGEKRIAVLDGTGRLKEAVTSDGTKGSGDAPEASRGGPQSEILKQVEGQVTSTTEQTGRKRRVPMRFDTQYVSIVDQDPKAAAQPYLARLRAEDEREKLDGVFVIPPGAFEDEKTRLLYYSRSSTDIISQERFGRLVNRALEKQRLSGHGLSAEQIDKLLTDLSVDAIQVSKSGEETKGGEMNFMMGFLFVIMMFVPILFYGQEILRGIIQEKTDRIVEILVSSMSPMELLVGKILGMAAVGLTQMAIWMTMGGALASYGAAVAMAGGMNLSSFFRPLIAVYFVVFFLLGYLIYVCVYAVGGAIVNSEKEAQQVLAPVVMILMVPWFLVMPIIMSPDSRMATVLSLIPIYTPITMFIRVLVSEPPAWQIGLSILMAIGSIYALFWITAKIFRVGLLSYGKRPTIPELWRWVKLA